MTIVPIGSVLWAHVPGGAASYHVAPPLWVRPDGAVLAADPDDPDAGLGAGLAGAAAGLAATFTVVVVRRGTVVDGAVLGLARTVVTAVVDVGGAAVVGGGIGAGVSGAGPSSTT